MWEGGLWWMEIDNSDRAAIPGGMSFSSGLDRAALGGLDKLRHDYPDLYQHVGLFHRWLDHYHRPGTARSYTGAVRTSLVKMLIKRQPPAEALAASGASAGTAWRLFLAFLRMGSPPRASMAPVGPAAPGLVPEAILKLVRRHVATKLGDKMEEMGLGPCLRALWPVFGPTAYEFDAKLYHALWPSKDGLWLKPWSDPQPFSEPYLRTAVDAARVLRAGPDQLRAATFIALWSYAGADETQTHHGDTPLLRASPAVLGETYEIVTMPAVGIWDVLGRPAAPLPVLPPEGEAVLAGEAIDLSGVEPLFPSEEAGSFKTLWNRRWGATPPHTADERLAERIIFDAFHRVPTFVAELQGSDATRAAALSAQGIFPAWADPAGAPLAYGCDPGPGALKVDPVQPWNLVVDVAGVPALGENAVELGAAPAEVGMLTDRELSPEPEEGLTSHEVPPSPLDAATPPPLAEVEAFDTPELPPA